MIVADANVLAYLHIQGDHTADQRVLRAFPEIAVSLTDFAEGM